MMQFIEVGGVMINLGNLATAEINLRKEDKVEKNVLTLTFLTGLELDYEGDDAEAITQRLNLLTMQTAADCTRLAEAAAQADAFIRQQQGAKA